MSKITMTYDSTSYTYSFTCPLINKKISERGEIELAACAKCNYNSLHQFIDNNVYCEYLSGSSSSSEDISTLSSQLAALTTVVNNNIEDDAKQQEQIDNQKNQISYNTAYISEVGETIGWENYQNN